MSDRRAHWRAQGTLTSCEALRPSRTLEGFGLSASLWGASQSVSWGLRSAMSRLPSNSQALLVSVSLFPVLLGGGSKEGWLAPARLLSLGGRLKQEPHVCGCYARDGSAGAQDVTEHRGHGVPKPSQCRQDPSQLQSGQLGISTRKTVT